LSLEEATPTADPRTADACLRRAAALDARGRNSEAREAYLAILADAPNHAATLNHLGSLLRRTGYRSAARTAFARAAACHPEQPDGHVNLAHLLREDGDAAGARRHYEAALRCAPDLPEAHQGLGNVFSDAGNAVQAEHHWRIGFRERVFSAWPYRGLGPPVRVLLLTAVGGGNIPAQALLDDTIFAVVAVAMEFWSPSLPLPPHDLLFNAIGDADLCGKALAAAVALVQLSAAPVVNRPQAVLPTGRLDNARRLATIPGVVAPRMALWPRAALSAPDAAAALARAGFAWPLLLRAPGFHTGQHFARVDAAGDLAATAASLPGEAVLVIDYLASASRDRLSRKFRVMIVDGALYPLHLAISRHWRVHYFTAAMAENPEHRAEEARFLADMPGLLGPRAVAALAGIAEMLGLDYAGIDFALGADGAVHVFEANATMAIVPPTAEPIWDYRRAAIARVTAATNHMLLRRAGLSKGGP
jgi:tetratricopeptide (TPR) repeat protein